MKKIILLIVLILLLQTNPVFAESEEEIMETTKEKFDINQFIEDAESYTGEFLENTDLKQVLEQAIQGNIDNKVIYGNILKLLGKEINLSIGTLVSILVIVVIHGILKSITDELENNNISQIIYFVQYILIVTLIMSNFTEMIKLVKETAEDLVGFINVLLPLLLTLMLYTGSITTSTILEPIILFAINLISNAIKNLLIPVVFIIVVFSIISKISEKVQIEKLSKFLRTGVVWVLGIVLT